MDLVFKHFNKYDYGPATKKLNISSLFCSDDLDMLLRAFCYKILIIIPTNAQLVLLYTVRLHVSTFIGHHQGTKEYQRL
jgi:hypothetical protein